MLVQSDPSKLDGIECPSQVSKNISKKRSEISNEEFQIISKRHAIPILEQSSKRSILKSMTLINFMCHDYLTVNFSSPITFIIGQNGSGKSAILTALMVCLGSATNKTQRGHKASDLIKENSPYSTITIVLDNSQEYSRYKHDEYEDQIIIERRISRDGSGHYKTKSQSGNIISTKKSEIISICDYFRFMVDNPVAILTQDDAKKYLITSIPEDLYRLFMEGTCLQQLSKDYQYVKQRISNIKISLEALESSRNTLLLEVSNLEHQVTTFRQLKTIQEKIQSLKNELVWAHPKEKAIKCDITRQNIIQLEQRLSQCLAKKQALQSQIDQLNSQLNKPESASLSELESYYKQVTSQIHMLDSTLHQMETDQTRINSSINQIQTSLSELQNILNRDTNEETTLSQKQTIQQLEIQLNDLTKSLGTINNNMSNIENDTSQLERQIVSLQEKSRQTDHDLGRIQSQIFSLESNVSSIRNSIKDHSRIYGQNIPQVLKYLNEKKFHHIGPIGLMIKLKDQSWATAMEAIVGRFLGSFIVTSYKERELLRNILYKFQCDNQILLVSDDQYYDTNNNGQHLTALQVLDIKDRLVTKALCHLTNIDRILLCKTRTEAIPILQSSSFICAFTIDASKITLNRTGQSFFSYKQNHSKHFDDPQIQLNHILPNIDAKKKEKSEIEECKSNISSQLNNVKNDLEKSKKSFSNCMNEKKMISQRMIETKRQLDAATMLITNNNDHEQLEKERMSYERQLELLDSQLDTIIEKKKEVEEKKKPSLTSQMNRLRSEIDSTRNEMRIREELTEQILLKKQSLEHDIHGCISDENSIIADINIKNRSLKELEQELEQETQQAEQYVSRDKVGNIRIIPEIERELRDAQIHLDQSQVPLDKLNQVVSDLNRKRQESRQLSVELDHLARLSTRLEESVKLREEHWVNYRKFICIRSKITFSGLMGRRGFNGDLVYSHSEKKLQLVVKVPEQKEKHSIESIKSLSGGEKSLATTCFLLSLWESMETPLRCLDEFDVFMDGVNRQVILDLLIENAKKSGLQYIFITPQALNRNDINVIRMSDPERIKTSV